MAWPFKSRTMRRTSALIRRRLDGSLWVAWHPQNIGIAMASLFTDSPGYHFVKARWRKGKLIVSRRVFWRPTRASMFDIVDMKHVCELLPAWPEAVESRKILKEGE